MTASRELTFSNHYPYRFVLLVALMVLGLMSGCKSSLDSALEDRAATVNQTSTPSASGSDASGSGSNSGSAGSSGTSGGDTPASPAEPSRLTVLADHLQLQSGGSGSVRITANVRDSHNVVQEGAVVSFSASSGSLKIEQGVTDSVGNAVAVLSSPYDPTPRTIKVTVEAPGTSAEVQIAVTGTSIEMSGPQNAISAGQSAALLIKLRTGDGGVLKNQPVTITSAQGNTLSETQATTDDQGQAHITVTDTAGVDDTITATALDGLISATFRLKVSQDNSLTFVTPTPEQEINLNSAETVSVKLIRGGVPASGAPVTLYTNRGGFGNNKSVIAATTDSDGVATVSLSSHQAGGATIKAETDSEAAEQTIEFVATTPTVLKLDASPSTVSFGQTSLLTVIVRDANDNLVKNQDIVFHVDSDITGGTLQTSGAVKTDSLGRATAVYHAGSSASGQNGVEISAYIADSPAISATTRLTVDPANTRIIIGTGNQMSEPNETQYEHPFVVQVSDDGAPVASAAVTLRAYPVVYRKGYWEGYDSDLDGKLDAWRPKVTAVCVAEDVDRDGELDAGEDINQDGELTPSAVATLVSSVVTTDENGFAPFSLIYPQNFAEWVTLDLVAQTSQADGEAWMSTQVTLPAIESDVKDYQKAPPGGSPFGVGTSCNDTL